MSMHKGMTGRGEPGGPVTLKEYLVKKYPDVMEQKKKLTFDEWYSQSGWAARHTECCSLDDAASARYIMYIAWTSALQENAQ